jgi:hypothetical protein
MILHAGGNENAKSASRMERIAERKALNRWRATGLNRGRGVAREKRLPQSKTLPRIDGHVPELFAKEVERYFAGVGVGAVFPEVEALPGAEGHFAVVHGDGEVDGGQRGADVGGHIVIAFGGVDEEGIAIANEAGEEGFEVAADVGVGVFLDEERGGSVLEVEGQEAVAALMGAEPLFDGGGEIGEAAAAGGDGEFVEVLVHGLG